MKNAGSATGLIAGSDSVFNNSKLSQVSNAGNTRAVETSKDEQEQNGAKAGPSRRGGRALQAKLSASCKGLENEGKVAALEKEVENAKEELRRLTEGADPTKAEDLKKEMEDLEKKCMDHYKKMMKFQEEFNDIHLKLIQQRIEHMISSIHRTLGINRN